MKTSLTRSLKFVSYARRSSSGESKQIASIGDQEKIFREITSQEHLTVVHHWKESHSALKPDTRPVFREMVNYIKAGKANALLVWHVNRVARNPKESGEIQQLLHDGVIQCIKTPEREYHPEDHALLFAVEAAMSNQSSRDLRRDVRRGTDEKAGRGWYPHKPKAGYALEGITKEVIPDPFRFALLRRAWELMLTGDKSVPEVLVELTSWGYRTQRTKSGGNKPISRSSLYRLFSDPFYTGVFQYYGESFEGKHQPMVSKEEFLRVQRILGHPVKASPKEYFHPFAGLMVCGVCGCQITAETHVKYQKSQGTSRSYTYYHCTGRKGCPKTSNDEQNIEEQILRDLEGCRLDPYFADWALDVLKREGEDAAKLARTTSATSSSSENILTRRLEAVQTMREDGELTRDEYLERKEKLKAELDQLKEAKHYLLTKADRDRETLKRILIFGRDGYNRFTRGDKERKRAVAREFSAGYVLTQGNLAISKHPALDRIRTFEPPKSRNQQSNSGSSGPLNPTWRTMLDAIQNAVETSDEPFPLPAGFKKVQCQREDEEPSEHPLNEKGFEYERESSNIESQVLP